MHVNASWFGSSFSLPLINPPKTSYCISWDLLANVKIGPASLVEGLVGALLYDVLHIKLGLKNAQLERILDIS